MRWQEQIERSEDHVQADPSYGTNSAGSTEAAVEESASGLIGLYTEGPWWRLGILWFVTLGLSWVIFSHRRQLVRGIGVCWELIKNLWSGPNWWLVPVILILLPAAAVLVFLEAVPVVAPFVYTVF